MARDSASRPRTIVALVAILLIAVVCVLVLLGAELAARSLEPRSEGTQVAFMMQVFQIKEEKRPLIPAVTHVDGSGRLQTVHRHTNPEYHHLIESFRDLTGVPMVNKAAIVLPPGGAPPPSPRRC